MGEKQQQATPAPAADAPAPAPAAAAPERTLVTVKDPLAGIAGSEELFLDGKTHIGVTVTLKASSKESQLSIPDVTQVASGRSPIFITKPVKIEGKNLKAFLEAKKMSPGDKITKLIGDSYIQLGAFYYKADQKKKASEENKELKAKYTSAENAVTDAKTALEGNSADTTKQSALKEKEGLLASAKAACEADNLIQTGVMLMNLDINFGAGLIGNLTGDESLGKLFDVTGASLNILKCDKNQLPALKEYVKQLNAD